MSSSVQLSMLRFAFSIEDKVPLNKIEYLNTSLHYINKRVTFLCRTVTCTCIEEYLYQSWFIGNSFKLYCINVELAFLKLELARHNIETTLLVTTNICELQPVLCSVVGDFLINQVIYS